MVGSAFATTGRIDLRTADNQWFTQSGMFAAFGGEGVGDGVEGQCQAQGRLSLGTMFSERHALSIRSEDHGQACAGSAGGKIWLSVTQGEVAQMREAPQGTDTRRFLYERKDGSKRGSMYIIDGSCCSVSSTACALRLQPYGLRKS